MELTVWFVLALTFVAVVVTKVASGRVISDPVCTRPLPPVLNGITLVGLLPTLYREGLQATLGRLNAQFGGVFTISFLGKRVTFLVGPEVSGHFFQGLDSEISHGNLFELMVPIHGKEVAFGVDAPTRMEQTRFITDALKPAQLRIHAGAMLQEVEDYFAKWGQEGEVDIKHELEQILMLITTRCLLGKEFREKMTSEFFALFHEMENAVNLISFLFPYMPIPANRRRDRARIKLSKIISEIVRSHKMLKCTEDDMIQGLIDSKYKDGRSTNVAEVIGMIICLIFAGKHTSSHSSSWTGACLLGHAKWLTAAVEEQKQLIRKYNDKIDYNVLLEMDTLHSCIKEALRMHPPVPFFLLKVQKPYTVRTKHGNEYGIPRADILVSPTILNSHIPYVYKDPEVYDPCRFLPGREEDKIGGKFSYTIFSAGRHACTGEAYAYMQIKIIWSHLLRNFELGLISPFPQGDWSKFVPEPKGKLMVSYKRRCLSST